MRFKAGRVRNNRAAFHNRDYFFGYPKLPMRAGSPFRFLSPSEYAGLPKGWAIQLPLDVAELTKYRSTADDVRAFHIFAKPLGEMERNFQKRGIRTMTEGICNARHHYVPTVFVVDDDRQLLESLAPWLEALDFQVRVFSCPRKFLDYYRAEMRGCLILDIRMPTRNGLELYEQLLREGKRLPVIYMTAHADVATAVAAMKMGAVEIIEKPFDSKILIDFIHRALNLDSQWRARDAQIADLEDRVSRLSDREMETLRLIQAGESNKSMAATLLLTERAVEMRRSAIMRKLQVNNVAELLNLTITHRILTDLRDAAVQSDLTGFPSARYRI
jgi:FixJ family two-component response regulator